MKQALAIGCVLVAAIGYALFAGSCLVDKRSNEFECSDQGQCGPGRICASGHCVIDTTPPPTRRRCARRSASHAISRHRSLHDRR
jgi:hypothetical protein